jgi:nucleotide-binding universal stress UspA family protein
MKTILFPTDFSERSHQALDQAIACAEQLGMKLLIYHTYTRPVTEWNTGRSLTQRLQALERRIDATFDKLPDQHKQLSGVPYEFRKGIGLLDEEIISIVQEEEIALIIMATKGAKGFGELWGTKTARIVKGVSVPVLVLPDHTSLNAVEKVGLVCDYSKEANYHTLDFMLKLVKALGLDIDVITLNRDQKTLTSQQLAYQQLVRKKLEDASPTFHSTFNSQVEEGIMEYSAANGIGLIAILPKSHGFIEGLFRESLTKKMTFHSSIPLLVLK